MKIKHILPPFIAIFLLLVLWEVCVWAFHIEVWLLPSPSRILTTLFLQRDLLLYHAGQTIVEALLGMLVGTIVGVAIAVAMEWSQFFNKILKPFVIMSQSIPYIALAPLLVIWLGFGIFPKVIIIALAYFLPVTINTYDGFRSADQNIIRLFKSMHASKWQIFTMVKVPSSLPYFFSGFRIAGAYVIGVAVVSEWIGADRGLGIFLVRAAKSYLTDSVFAVIFVVTILSLLVVFLIDKLTAIAIPWYYHRKERAI